jgi:hypothetical protein
MKLPSRFGVLAFLQLAVICTVSLALAIVFSVPVLAVGNAVDPGLAAEVAAQATIPLAKVASVFALIASIGTALLPFTSKLPGWATYSNVAMIVIGVVAAIADKLLALAQVNPYATLTGVLFAAIGAAISYTLSERRAAPHPEIVAERVDALRAG